MRLTEPLAVELLVAAAYHDADEQQRRALRAADELGGLVHTFDSKRREIAGVLGQDWFPTGTIAQQLRDLGYATVPVMASRGYFEELIADHGLEDLDEDTALSTLEAKGLLYSCGHTLRMPGCGGCDPGAIDFIIEDDGVIHHVGR